MMQSDTHDDPVQVAYRRDGRRVFATLVRLLGDFDLAEDALQNAFAAAAERWPQDGMPANPVAWLVSAGRFRAIDQIRRQRRAAPWSEVDEKAESLPDPAPLPEDRDVLEDDRLRLIFTCCHPSLSEQAAVALTLREICGLSTEAVASACLVAPATLAQRIVRAKTKIRDARIPYEVPDAPDLPARLGQVLRVVYLVFNEGYSAAQGTDVLRPDLTAEAIRLARLLLELLPEPEVRSLLALMVLQDSRRAARTDGAGDLVPLDAQDRALWDTAAIAEGRALARDALGSGRAGSYSLQAAIAACHAVAPAPEATDWAAIAGFYDALLSIEPSPVVALNRAVAVGMRDGPEAGLPLVDALLQGGLDQYHLAHAAKADLLRRAGRGAEARASYAAALALTRQEPERRFLARRMADLDR